MRWPTHDAARARGHSWAIWFVQRRHQSVADPETVTLALETGPAETAEQAMLDHTGHGCAATVEHLHAIGSPETSQPIGIGWPT